MVKFGECPTTKCGRLCCHPNNFTNCEMVRIGLIRMDCRNRSKEGCVGWDVFCYEYALPYPLLEFFMMW